MSKMKEKDGPKIIDYVVKNEWNKKISEKSTLKIMQNVVQNEW